ncbi:hypothetical protein PCC79_13330 [Propioniciclava soli]|uniref:Lipoprotein n=1 Tax=Propioniciclava soli TaxID=2775081 RepID=A0ABZ3C4Z9_9ACTN
MTRVIHTRAIIAAIVATGLLAGCGGQDGPAGQDGASAQDEAAGQGGIFDFSSPTMGPAEEIVVEIPEGLKEAMGPDGENLFLQRATLTAYELDGAQNCAVRIDLEWAPGADELIASSSSSDDGPNYGFALGYVYHHPLSELSPDGEGPGNFFIADDYSHAVRVNDCAASPMDDDNSSALDFKFLRDGDMTDGAEIDFTVMKDGSITIVDSDVEDFDRDSNGDWVAD